MKYRISLIYVLCDEVAQLEADIDALVDWAKTDNPIEDRQKWNALPEHIRNRISSCPYDEEFIV